MKNSDRHPQVLRCTARRLTAQRRSGLSLMEVMFSIGVLLIGIVGLAHVLPIGMNQSADAVNADKSLIAMENLVSQTIIQADVATRQGLVIADRWRPVNVSGQDFYLAYQPTATDYRFGICVDPWFLTAAFNKRNSTNVYPSFDHRVINGYDRSLFPCYDRGYNPLVSPSEALYDNAGNETTAWGNFNESLWNAPYAPYPTTATAAQIAANRPREPRFLRVAPASASTSSNVVPRHVAERAFAAQSAEPAMITPEKDKTLPAGRRYLGGATPVSGSSVGRYSALSFIVSHEDDPETLRVSTAVTKNRIPTIDPSASSGSNRFNLSPYTYNARTAPYYEGEQLAYIQTVTPATMTGFASGLGGQVELVMHRVLPVPGQPDQPAPSFRTGQYLMFMRHVYPIRTVVNNAFSSGTADGPVRLAFDWFKIADVVGDPATNLEGRAAAAFTTDPHYGAGTSRPVWRITLDLRGPAWLFDDDSRINSGTYTYTPDTYQDGTYVVWMPDVVGVHERTLSLRGR